MEDSAKFLHLTFDSGAEDAATAASSGTCDWSGDDTSMPAFPPPSFDRSTAELEAEPGWSILTSLVVLDFDFRRVKLCFRLASSFKCVRIQKHYATKIVADYLSQSNLDIRQLCVTRNFNRRTITFLRLLQRILSSIFQTILSNTTIRLIVKFLTKEKRSLKQLRRATSARSNLKYQKAFLRKNCTHTTNEFAFA